MDNTNDNIKKPGKYGIPAPKRAKAIFSDDSIDIGNILIDSMPDPLTEEESRQIYMKMPNLQISKDASQRMQLDELMKLSKIRVGEHRLWRLLRHEASWRDDLRLLLLP